MKKVNICFAGLFQLGIAFSRNFPLLTQRVKCKLEKSPVLKIRTDILNYFKTHPNEIKDEEMKEALAHIKKDGLAFFPYSWAKQYNPLDVKIYDDEQCGLKYVLHDGKRLYFRASSSEFRVKLSYNALLEEQNIKSPHCYLNGKLQIDDDSILFDVGAAEGIFALSEIENSKEVYLFETDPEWILPLQKTFEPWKEKVHIINKYASDTDSEDTVTIDTILASTENGNVFLKLDVEGAEKLVLTGARKSLRSESLNVKAAVCTYHYPHDYQELTSLMTDVFGYNYETSDGYMCCFHGNYTPPEFFRRAMIYCQK